eukprot:scaffold803_cov310-Pinguiococcus_pyrenoidosus.AAC.127
MNASAPLRRVSTPAKAATRRNSILTKERRNPTARENGGLTSKLGRARGFWPRRRLGTGRLNPRAFA